MDLTYRPTAEPNLKQIEAEVVTDILTFVDTMMDEDTDVAEVTPEIKEDLAAVHCHRDRNKAGGSCSADDEAAESCGEWHQRAV